MANVIDAVAKQSSKDSMIEVLLNTFVGYVVAVVMWHFLAQVMGLALSDGDNIFIVGCFTVTSIIRQYVLRRLFNGRSMWLTIKTMITKQENTHARSQP